MGFLNYIKKKKRADKGYENLSFIPDKAKSNFLKKEFFDTMLQADLKWNKRWLKYPDKDEIAYLPCHLNDIEWISKVMHEKILSEKSTYISEEEIKGFLKHNKTYGHYKYLYQLKIVKCLIEHIMKGGQNWLLPQTKKEMKNISSQDPDIYIREGIVRTLTSLGLDKNIIEAGIEKNANLWRDQSMMQTFKNEFEPVDPFRAPIMPASQKHKTDWLKLRKYEYYERHKDAVNKYGNLNDLNPNLNEEDLKNLKNDVARQNKERKAFVLDWLQGETINNMNMPI